MIRHVRFALAAVLSFSAGSAGCGVLDFDIEQPVDAQTIPGTGVPAPLAEIFPLPLSIDLESKIEMKNLGPIDSVTLSSLALQITSRDGDWAFVTRIDVSVESAKSGSKLPSVQIASAASVGAMRIMTFGIKTGVNLKPYIDEGTKVVSRCTGVLPTHDVTFDGKAVFTVHPL